MVVMFVVPAFISGSVFLALGAYELLAAFIGRAQSGRWRKQPARSDDELADARYLSSKSRRRRV